MLWHGIDNDDDDDHEHDDNDEDDYDDDGYDDWHTCQGLPAQSEKLCTPQHWCW